MASWIKRTKRSPNTFKTYNNSTGRTTVTNTNRTKGSKMWTTRSYNSDGKERITFVEKGSRGTRRTTKTINHSKSPKFKTVKSTKYKNNIGNFFYIFTLPFVIINKIFNWFRNI